MFVNYKMWFWRGERSKIENVWEIDDKLVKDGTFIFIGKIMDVDNLDYDDIISTFDDLLNVYLEVETEVKPKTQPEKAAKIDKFIFDNKIKHLPQKISYNAVEKEINVDARHSYLQKNYTRN